MGHAGKYSQMVLSSIHACRFVMDASTFPTASGSNPMATPRPPIHTHTRSLTRSLTHKHIHIHRHARTHARSYARTRGHAHTDAHTRGARTRGDAHTHARKHTHARTRTRVHAHADMHTHTRTCTDTRVRRTLTHNHRSRLTQSPRCSQHGSLSGSRPLATTIPVRSPCDRAPPCEAPPCEAPPCGAPPGGAPPCGAPPCEAPPVGGAPPVGLPRWGSPGGAPPVGLPRWGSPGGAPPVGSPCFIDCAGLSVRGCAQAPFAVLECYIQHATWCDVANDIPPAFTPRVPAPARAHAVCSTPGPRLCHVSPPVRASLQALSHAARYPTRHGIPRGTVSHAARYPTRHGIPRGTVSQAARYPAHAMMVCGSLGGARPAPNGCPARGVQGRGVPSRGVLRVRFMRRPVRGLAPPDGARITDHWQ
jgi:hypothetical protein